MQHIKLAPDIEIYHADCMELVDIFKLTKIDAVLTDPPWGIDGGSGTLNKKRGKGNYGGSFEDTPSYVGLCADIIKKMIPHYGAVVVTPGFKNMMLYPQPDSFGCFYQPASCGMQRFGNVDSQPIFYYGRNLTGKNMGKPLSFKLTEQPEKNGHPCVKPILAWTRLLTTFTLERHTILDPFMGSGTTGIACIKTNRKFIGVEIEKKFFDIAKERLLKELDQGLLFQ